MSGLQKIDPTAQKFIQLAQQSGKDCSYSKTSKGFLGNTLESVTVEVLDGSVYVSETEVKPPVVGDWLQVIGGVAIVVIGLFVIVQGVKGVLKSEQSFGGNGVIGITAIVGGGTGMDG